MKFYTQTTHNKRSQRISGCYGGDWRVIAFLLLTSCFFFSCEDFVAIDPPKDQLVSETVFTNNENATAAIRGIYRELINSSVFASGTSSITFLGGLSVDELVGFGGWDNFYHNELIAENGSVSNNWSLLYNIIYQTNAVLEGLENSTGITPEVKELLEGEAKCLRAFCYFYLVNLWGEVPLIIDTDYEKNRLASRISVSEVYDLIVRDLTDAQELLPEDYTHAGGERIRVNESAATALLARAYLYLEEWANAEAQATAVIENTIYTLAGDLNSVYLKNSTEAIWQLKPLVGHTEDGNIFILTAPPSFAALSDHVVNAFETGDEREANWTGNFTDATGTWNYPFKYKVKSEPDLENATEYSMVLRLAEQYLIRAEARAQQDNLTGANSAESDLNMIRNRANLGNTTATTKEEMLNVILEERRVELFTEWGHRWLDLKRTGRADVVLGPIKSGWESTDILWPIPQSEINSNPNLTQNSGY